MDAARVQVTGKVVWEGLDEGSKSERQAVTLQTDSGGHYVLRQRNAPSFGDGGLDHLVGSTINAGGIAVGNTLIVEDWTTLE